MKIGKAGEQTAERFLKRNNYKIIKRNFNCKAGEIDIIAEINNVIVFVEVKTRSNFKYGRPSESVTSKKRNHLLWAAHYFIALHGEVYDADEYRFDVIEVLKNNDKTYVNHIENAFQ